VSFSNLSNAERIRENVDRRSSIGLNDLIKCLFLSLNWWYCLLGIMMLVWTVYYTSISWAKLEGNTMESLSTILICSASVILVVIIGGCAGALNQVVREGPCRGRRLLGLYEAALVAIVVLQFFAVVYILNSIAGLNDVKGSLKSGHASITVPYTPFEDTMSDRFNDYYFSTLGDQTTSGHKWFWKFVDGHCPNSMRSTSCTEGAMEDNCPDHDTCNLDDDNARLSCPYEVCRLPAIREALSVLEPIGTYSLILILFELFIVILACMLACYNPHDNYATIQSKLMGMALPRSEASNLAMIKHMKDRSSRRQSVASPKDRTQKDVPSPLRHGLDQTASAGRSGVKLSRYAKEDSHSPQARSKAAGRSTTPATSSHQGGTWGIRTSGGTPSQQRPARAAHATMEEEV